MFCSTYICFVFFTEGDDLTSHGSLSSSDSESEESEPETLPGTTSHQRADSFENLSYSSDSSDSEEASRRTQVW